MSLTITQVNLPQSQYAIKCPYSMEPEGLTIHNTANDASAMAEVSYMQGNPYEVSFHYAVDDTRAVQGLPLNRNGWHAGDGGSGKGNRKTIGLEICYSKSGGTRFTEAEKNGAILAAMILKAHGWGIERMGKHQDYWQGTYYKYCPHRTLDLGWKRFVNMVQAELDKLNGKTVQPPKTEVKPATPTAKTIDQLADEVVAGKHGTGEARKKSLGSQYDAVQKRVNEKLGATSAQKTPAKKPNDTIANEVINGKWGNGADREKRLKAAGYNPTTIQNLVNQKLGSKTTSRPKTTKKTNAQIAREIYNGVGNWGTGQTRVDRLRKAGYDPVAVQREVNKLF